MKHLLALLLALTSTAHAYTYAGSDGQNVNSDNFINALGGTAAGKSLFQAADAAAQRAAIGAPSTSHTHAASDITSGVLDPARLGTGSSISSKYLRGDGTWQTVSSGGDLTSGPVTSSGGVSAIADGALTTAKTSGLPAALTAGASINEDALNMQLNCVKKIISWTNTSAPPLWLAMVGDSLCTGLTALENMCIKGWISQGTYGTAGTAPANTATDDWLNGKVISLATGSTVQFSKNGGTDDSLQASKATIVWIQEPTGGAGTFDIQYRAYGTGSWTTFSGGSGLSTYNASKIATSATFDLSTSNSPPYSIRVTNITGKAIKLIAWGLYYHNSGGVVVVNGVFNETGRDLVSWPNCPDGIFNPAYDAIAPDLVFSCWADPASEWDSGGNWRTQYARMIARKSTTDFVQISKHRNYVPTYASFSTWTTGTAYALNATVYDAGDGAGVAAMTYKCTSAHTSGSTTRPGIGASWTSYWTKYYDPTAVSLSDADTKAQVVAQRAWASSAGQTAVSTYRLFGDDTATVVPNWLADNVHLGGEAQRLRNAWLTRTLQIGQFPLGKIGGSTNFAAYAAPFSLQSLGVSNPSNSVTELDRPLFINGGTGSALYLFNQNGNLLDRGDVAKLYCTGGILKFNYQNGDIMEMRQSSSRGLWPSNNDSMLGASSKKWRLGAGGISAGYVEKTANYTLTTADYTCNVTSNSPTITLPSANTTDTAAGVTGQIYIIKNSGAGTVTIGGTVDGTSNPTIVTGASPWWVQSTGTTWTKIN